MKGGAYWFGKDGIEDCMIMQMNGMTDPMLSTSFEEHSATNCKRFATNCKCFGVS